MSKETVNGHRIPFKQHQPQIPDVSPVQIAESVPSRGGQGVSRRGFMGLVLGGVAAVALGRLGIGPDQADAAPNRTPAATVLSTPTETPTPKISATQEILAAVDLPQALKDRMVTEPERGNNPIKVAYQEIIPNPDGTAGRHLIITAVSDPYDGRKTASLYESDLSGGGSGAFKIKNKEPMGFGSSFLSAHPIEADGSYLVAGADTSVDPPKALLFRVAADGAVKTIPGLNAHGFAGGAVINDSSVLLTTFWENSPSALGIFDAVKKEFLPIPGTEEAHFAPRIFPGQDPNRLRVLVQGGAVDRGGFSRGFMDIEIDLSTGRVLSRKEYAQNLRFIENLDYRMDPNGELESFVSVSDAGIGLHKVNRGTITEEKFIEPDSWFVSQNPPPRGDPTYFNIGVNVVHINPDDSITFFGAQSVFENGILGVTPIVGWFDPRTIDPRDPQARPDGAYIIRLDSNNRSLIEMSHIHGNSVQMASVRRTNGTAENVAFVAQKGIDRFYTSGMRLIRHGSDGKPIGMEPGFFDRGADAQSPVSPTATRTPGGPTETPTRTPLPSRTPTAAATETSTASPTAISTSSATATETATASPSATPDATATSLPTVTATAAESTPTSTATPEPTSTPTPSATPSATREPTLTSTPTSTPDASATATPTGDPLKVVTPTPTGTPTPKTYKAYMPLVASNKSVGW